MARMHTCNPVGMTTGYCLACLETQTEFESSEDKSLSAWVKRTPNATQDMLDAWSDGYNAGADDWGDN